MRLWRFFILLSLTLYWSEADGQSTMTWQDFVEEVADDERTEEEGWSEQMEELALLAANPLDINTATKEQLRQLPFLSEEQIEEIQTYIFLHKGMRSMGELMAVKSIDLRTRQYLSIFLKADPSVFERHDTLRLKTMLQDANHELSTRTDIPLYYRLGYSYPAEKGGYRGEPIYHNMRYMMSDNRHLSLGFQAEKDQGEPFRGNGGWDMYGAHIMVRDIHALRTAIVGDYKIGFGEGLVVGSSFVTDKSSLMKRPSQGIRAKRGMDEINYFRGAAASFALKNITMTTWVSHRRLDASLDDDGSVSTLQTSGLHRTTKEMNMKRNTMATMVGGNLSWQKSGFHAGTTGYYQRFSRILSPGKATYRQIYPKGKNFGIVSVDYGYRHPWFKFDGETAYSTERGGWATLNRASWKVNPRYTLSGSYRFYSYKYYSFHSTAICENTRVQNESGANLRLDCTPISNLTISTFADLFYNPWPRYSVNHSSKGQEIGFQGQYLLQRKNRFDVRYRLKHKERSNKMELHHRIRFQYTRQQGNDWQLQSMLNLHAMRGSGTGWSLSQRARFQHRKGQTSAMLTYFQTPDYQTRIFLYEPMLTNMFRFPSFYGQGLRLVATGRIPLWHNHLMLEALYGLTKYLDRKTQSSGMDEIRSPWKQDISLQLRLRI